MDELAECRSDEGQNAPALKKRKVLPEPTAPDGRVRVIACDNLDLADEVDAAEFRRDLYGG